MQLLSLYCHFEQGNYTKKCFRVNLSHNAVTQETSKESFLEQIRTKITTLHVTKTHLCFGMHLESNLLKI